MLAIGLSIFFILVVVALGMVAYYIVSNTVKFVSQHWLPILTLVAVVGAAIFGGIDHAGVCLLIGGIIGVIRWLYNKFYKKK